MTSNTAHAQSDESHEELRRRIAWEAEGLARARASVAAGRMIDAEAIDAWIDSLGTDQELPLPRPGDSYKLKVASASRHREPPLRRVDPGGSRRVGAASPGSPCR